MFLSVLLPSFGTDFAGALGCAVEMGFTHVDVVGLVERPDVEREALADSGLLVACAAIGRDLPDGCTLDACAVDQRRQAVALMMRQLADAANLGATHAYIVPGLDRSNEGLACFAEGCALLADHAGQRMITLCLEHIPGRALAGAADT